MRGKKERSKMNKINEMIIHVRKIEELSHQLNGRFEDGEYTIDSITDNDILDIAFWTKQCFEEENHNLWFDLLEKIPSKVKQYNQIKYFIKKWSN